MTRHRTPRHVDIRDIDPYRGNLEALERAEKAYDATIAREKADAATPRGRDHTAALGNSGTPLVLQRDTEGDTRPPTRTEVNRDLVEGSAALNSTSTVNPHTVPNESRNTTQGETMATPPPALRIEAPTTPQEYDKENSYYAGQVEYIRSLPPSPMTDLECEEMRRTIKVKVDRIQKWFEPLVTAAYNAHRALTGRRTQATAGLLACDDACRIKIGEHARLQRIEAEKERLRKEAIERQRRADEAKAQAEALAAQAADAEKAGDQMQAEMLMEEAQRIEDAPIAPVVLPPEPVYKPQNSIVLVRKKADMEKLDKVKLLAHCLGLSERNGAVHFQPNESLIAELLEFKENSINKLLNKGVALPGVAFYEVDDTRRKGR